MKNTTTLTPELHKSKFQSKFRPLRKEGEVEHILTELTTTISAFKQNPHEAMKKAKKKPFAVLTNNKATFYVLSPEYFDELLEKLWELEISPVVLEAMAGRDKSKAFTLAELRNL